MSKLKILLLVIFALLLVALSVWSFSIIKKQYADDADVPTVIRPPDGTDLPAESPVSNSPDDAPSDVIDENAAIDDTPPAPEKEPLIQIKREDCLNGCKKFSKTETFTYCQQSCGLATPQDNPGDCANKMGLNKDYCFKDLAIGAKDFNICDKISDKGIKKTCVTRITEELLQEQFKNSPPLPE